MPSDMFTIHDAAHGKQFPSELVPITSDKLIDQLRAWLEIYRIDVETNVSSNGLYRADIVAVYDDVVRWTISHCDLSKRDMILHEFVIQRIRPLK